MERVIERGCGLDVHKKTVTAGPTTADRLALRDWLEASGVTDVAVPRDPGGTPSGEAGHV